MVKVGRLAIFVATFVLGMSAQGAALAEAPPPSTYSGIAPDGRHFSGVVRGDRVIVDESIDPDRAIRSPFAAVEPAATPPSCVYARDNHPSLGFAYVYVDNDCTTIQRVKVLIAFDYDSSCMVIQPKTTVEFKYANSARFDGLEAC